MTRRKAPKDIKRKRLKPHQQPPKPTNRWWKIPLQGFLAVCTVAGILAFFPKLSAGVSGSSRPQDPLGTLFYVSNDGSIPVFDIKLSCTFRDLKIKNDDSFSGYRFVANVATAASLYPGKRLTGDCDNGFIVNRAVSVEAEIAVEYRPPLIWWRRKAVFEMGAERNSNGDWIWRNLPSN